MKAQGLFLFSTFVLGALSQVAWAAPDFAAGEVLVKYHSGLSSRARQASAARLNLTVLKTLDRQGLLRVKLPAHTDVNAALAALKNDPNVEYAQPNYRYRATAVPNDTLYSQLWGLDNTGQTIVSPGGPDSPDATNNPGTAGKDMSLESAWDIVTDCSSVITAVIDTGINYNHVDLSANVWTNTGEIVANGIDDDGNGYIDDIHGYDFVGTDGDPMDLNGHGTHVAGTIGAVGNNATGSTGVCWNATIMGLRVLNSLGSGLTSDIVLAVNYAVANGARVINMSLGGSSYDAAFSNAITNAKNFDVAVIVAAGNDTLNVDVSTPSYPCNFTQDNLICVAALDQTYALASFSNYGSSSVDVGAPGVNIVSEWPGTHVTTTDPLTAGWNGAGWGYQVVSGFNLITAPAAYDGSTVTYANNENSTFYKSFNTAGADAVSLSYYAAYDTEAVNDTFNTAYNNAGTDPFVAGTAVDSLSGTTGGDLLAAQYDIGGCASATCTVGFNLSSNATVVDFGVYLLLFELNALTLNNTTYNVIAGTSMATPHVAGVAAMLWAYNPSFTYSDVIRALKYGGVALSALTNTTTTGNSVDAHGALTYISPPAGVTATVYEHR